MNPVLRAKTVPAISPPWAEPFPQWSRIKEWSLRVAEFGVVQATVQLITAAAGLLIVRTMSKSDYALYAIANSMQVTGSLLADLGIGIGIRSIGGCVWNDRERFGQLVNTALSLRRRFALISLAFTLPLSAWMFWRNGANWVLTIGLCLTVIGGVVPLLQSAVFDVALRLHSQYRRIQKLDLGNATLRLCLIGALAFVKMNALMAALVGIVANWVQLIFAKYWAYEQANRAANINPQDRRELVRLSLKSSPNAVFFCFQGQVTLLILTMVGNPTGLADVTALGRIAALFAIFSICFGNVLAPRFARYQDPSRLRFAYLTLIGATVMVLFPFAVVAWLFPTPLLWLLGAKYASLGSECGWVVTAACVSQIGAVMWGLNSSKAWIRLQVALFIPVILAAQIIAALCLDLRSFHDVLIFNLVTAASPLPVYLADACIGLAVARRGQATAV